jgi:two-component system phosphate regulon sensor histidine kinase PhoR
MSARAGRNRAAWTSQWTIVILALSAMPAACFLALWLVGNLAGGPALMATLGCVAAAAVLASIWVRDVDLLSETVRQAALENAAALSAAAEAPMLPAIERVTRNIERLSRTLASRAALVGELLAANEAIVERLPDPLLVLGEDRGAKRANAAARAAFGADIQAVLRHPDLRTAIDRAYTQRSAQTASFTLPVPVQREVAATIIYMDPPLADGGRAIAVLSDRSRERAVERMRADFVANASHELRTPLASLIGFIATLQGPAADDPPAQVRFLAIMAEQAERMNRLIDDLMSLSRIELSEHEAPSEQVQLQYLVERVVAGFEPRVAARRVTLDLSLPADFPAIVADSDQMAQVVTNLVDNALKYGQDEGRISISLIAAAPGATRQGGKWPPRRGVVLAVADDGQGIAREHIPRLTERFYRVDKARSRGRGPGHGPSGTGLGLAIIKHIVNRHRGQLVIDSEEGRGSVFSVWLPASAEQQEKS